jgi:hypothetical protein
MKILMVHSEYNEWIDMNDCDYNVYNTKSIYFSHYYNDVAKKIQNWYKIRHFNKKLHILWDIAEYYMKKKYHPNSKFLYNYINKF